MTLEHSDQYFKVVSGTYSRYGGSGGSPKSALLKVSPHIVDYSHASPNGGTPNHFVAPRTNGTPLLLYSTVDAAKTFAASNKDRRRVYRAEVYGEVVTVAKVLKLNMGWSDHAVAFWAAVLAGQEYKDFATRNAPPGTIALFGVMRLLELIPN